MNVSTSFYGSFMFMFVDLSNTSKGCEYGDKVTWCEDYIQSNIDCYNQKDACCATCQKYRTNITGLFSVIHFDYYIYFITTLAGFHC